MFWMGDGQDNNNNTRAGLVKTQLTPKGNIAKMDTIYRE